MAILTIGGRSFDIAPYKLGDLKKAAKHIDAMNEVDASFEGAVQSGSDALAILLVGIKKLDPAMSLEELENMTGMEDLPHIASVTRTLLEESGLAKGEATAPPAVPVAPAGAAPTIN